MQSGIVLGHRVSSKGIEVDRVKIAAIEKLPPPKMSRHPKLLRTCRVLSLVYKRFLKDCEAIV